MGHERGLPLQAGQERGLPLQAGALPGGIPAEPERVPGQRQELTPQARVCPAEPELSPVGLAPLPALLRVLVGLAPWPGLAVAAVAGQC